ncbi:MAG: hypothetical protein HFI19_05545 [Lachnospiraceae bacterium]|jgi:hypothetical protein|nr:hypothetical protein [Lachnospiraceae bacterium]
MLRKRSKYLLYALIGAAAFLVIYGTDALHVTFDWWILNGYVEDDIIQHYAGWMAFRASDWSFPLGLAGNLGYPEGVVISFTDSIPLVSIFFKCLSGILPETFQFFGLYVLFCFMMQGLCAGCLMELFTEKQWGIYGSVVLFVFSPILIERAFRHTALASQWLILAALYFYFRSRKGGKLPWGFLPLQVLGVGLHPYFVPMICGILAAWALERLVQRRWAEWKETAAFLAGNLFVLILAGYVIGVFGNGVSGTAEGFGYYSMNLNALWNPKSLGVDGWSSVLPILEQKAGNYDGFNYLGLGVLLFGALGIGKMMISLKREKRFGKFCKSYIGLILFSVFCVLFAWSNVITFNGTTLFTIPLPEMVQRLCSVFRAGGRMFWPVYELLFLLACLTAIRFRGRAGMAALSALLVVQVFDLLPALNQKHGSVDENHMEAGSYRADFFLSEDWSQVLDAYDRAELLNYHHDYSLAALFMKHQVKSNILPANRGDFEKARERCREMTLQLYQGQKMEEGVLYLVKDSVLAEQLSWNLNEDLAAYDLGGYIAFGEQRADLTVKEAVFSQKPGKFAAIEEGSADWLYLRKAEEDEILLPATEVLEWELSRAEGLKLGDETVKIAGIERYSNENIRDYFYIKCEGNVDLEEWEHAAEIEIVYTD